MTGAGLEALRRPGIAKADRVGLLPAAAAAGAQVRSILDASEGLPSMERPRAMVVVGAQADIDAAFLIALLGRTAPSPILFAPALPPWVGALDLVVVLAAHPDDEAAAQAAGLARRRGAATVVRGAEHGPVADAAGPSLLPSVVAVPESLAACARWSLLALVAARAGLGPAVELTRTADLLDATALACHPGGESFLNPGINLAEYLGDGTAVLIGCDQLADAIAAHGAHALADLAGLVAGVVTAAQAGTSPALLRRVGGPKDLFADPFDEGAPQQVVKPLLVSTTPEGGLGRPPSERDAADRRTLSAILRSFSGAMHLDGSPDALPTVAGMPSWNSPELANAAGEVAALPTGADGFDAAVAAGLRLDFAAVYLGIATGQLAPADLPDGLGRAGGTRWAVRPATVSGVDAEQGVNRWS
jgi:hypothetical protein